MGITRFWLGIDKIATANVSAACHVEAEGE
jgi:hypothetical protein